LTRNLITRILAPHFGSNHSSLVAIKCSAFGIGLPNQQIAAAPIENHLIGQGFWGGLFAVVSMVVSARFSASGFGINAVCQRINMQRITHTPRVPLTMFAKPACQLPITHYPWPMQFPTAQSVGINY